MPTYEETKRDALAALSAGDRRQAFARFRWQLEYPGTFPDDATLADALLVLARISGEIAGPDFAGQLEAAASGLDDPQVLYDAGYALIEQSLHGLAATLLARAHTLAPNEISILAELSAALEGCDRHDEALRFLRGAGRLAETDFFVSYLLGFNAVMTADLALAREAASRLPALRKARGDTSDLRFMEGRLTQLLARAAAVHGATTLSKTDLRGWQFVVNGQLLLHLSPHGFDEGLRGRYAFSQDTEARCLEALRRLAAVLDAALRPPERIWLLPDRESTALGLAAAKHLGVPAQPWPGEEPGLVVAYDLASQRAHWETLHRHHPGQILWSHAASWTEPPPFAADVVTFVSQVNQSPWGERLSFDPKAGPRRLAAVEAEPAVLAEQILAAPLEADALADLEQLVALAKAAKAMGAAAGGLFLDEGVRPPQLLDSPVKSRRS